MDKQLSYRFNTLNENALLAHLTRCSDNYFPPLDTRVELVTYAAKLVQKADHFEAWCEDILIGTVSVYSSIENCSGFISNVSVDPDFSGRGIGNNLVSKAVAHLEKSGIRVVELEVNEQNKKATTMYFRLGFVEISRNEEIMRLQLKIN